MFTPCCICSALHVARPYPYHRAWKLTECTAHPIPTPAPSHVKMQVKTATEESLLMLAINLQLCYQLREKDHKLSLIVPLGIFTILEHRLIWCISLTFCHGGGGRWPYSLYRRRRVIRVLSEVFGKTVYIYIDKWWQHVKTTAVYASYVQFISNYRYHGKHCTMLNLLFFNINMLYIASWKFHLDTLVEIWRNDM